MFNKLFLPFVLTSIFLAGCNRPHTHEHEQPEGPEPLAYTVYTDKTVLFVEFPPLVKEKETKFAAHFTKLGESFTPYTEGTITLTLIINGKKESVTSTAPSSPGIFRLALKPSSTGTGILVFDIRTKEFSDQVTIHNISVYENSKKAEEITMEESEGDISFLKEQAWKIEFANIPVKKQPFNAIIKTSGQILAAPGDEMVVAAQTSGIVRIAGNKTITGSSVNAGAHLFTVTGENLTEGNINTDYLQAKAAFEKARIDYERAAELVKDQIISEKEFRQTKLIYDNAQTVLATVGKNYTGKGQTVSAPMSGFVKNLFVSDGQYVMSGTPLATISKNKKLLLQANVSQKYFVELPGIKSANFRTMESDVVYSTEQMNGRLISYGKGAAANSPFIPILFEIDNTGNLISGSAAEVFLKSSVIPEAIVLPVSALIEEQGNFYVYIQTAGESFRKAEVKIGASDGYSVQVLSGINEGERVVTKGAYQIKLSSAAGTLPAHGHEH